MCALPSIKQNLRELFFFSVIAFEEKLKHPTMADLKSKDLDLKQTAEREEEENVKRFITEIIRCLEDNISNCQLHELLMKLPAKINLHIMLVHILGGGSPFCGMTYVFKHGSGFQAERLRSTHLDSFLRILIACGFSVKRVDTHNTAQSTDNLLQTLHGSRLEVPSLLDLSYASVRSLLPQPASDEILAGTRLPKLLQGRVQREALLAYIMEILKRSHHNCTIVCSGRQF